MSRKTYKGKTVNDEIWFMVISPEEFEDWVKDGFWKDVADFEHDTGITYEDVKGKWFQLIHNRVYLEENENS